MPDKKRILLAYITPNSGHHRATRAIENSLKTISPSIEILNINAFGYTNPILEKVINRTYLEVIKSRPEVWEYLYDNPKVLKSVHGLRDVIHRLNSKKLKTLLEDFRPDVVLCTQAFPCGMIADYKKHLNLKLPLVGILTDHAPHSYWIFNDVDYYITPSEISKEHFIKNGVSKSKIMAFGIPIDPRFTIAHDKKELRAKMGFEHNLPIVLIMGGSQGLGPVENIVTMLENKDIPFQLAVVCGTNKKLEKVLEKRAPRYKRKLVVFGHVENIDELMEISSIILTKPGGLTTAEALSKDLPMIIIHPIPGQETKNTDFLLQQGVALRAEDSEDVATLVQELLLNPIKLADMRNRTTELKKPNAAMDIAKLALSI
ncbi:MAG: glycosyltransferase [Candidatus Omnitrophica bacterium]|nr:glycosyltransferase [Candidatus Omnitrophota bacterium]